MTKGGTIEVWQRGARILIADWYTEDPNKEFSAVSVATVEGEPMLTLSYANAAGKLVKVTVNLRESAFRVTHLVYPSA